MRHKIKFLFTFIVLAAILSGCNNDDGYSLDQYSVSYGTVEVDGSNAWISLDGGKALFVSATLIPGYKFEDGQRVIANYTILGQIEKPKSGYMVRLNNIYEVLSKKPVSLTFINENEEHRQDSIGKDPINVVDAWFGGKYLNINFDVAVSGSSSVKHFINLVNDDVSEEPAGNVNVTLRHNAYKDARNYWGFGRVSFDIVSLVPAGESEINVKLIWTDYNGETKSDSGKFKVNVSNAPSSVPYKIEKLSTAVVE